ncbi:MAG: hypothetical protein Q8K82_12590 [Gemmatimonadaceae bacterium]|nr:hypothetical protein [Gemmatimonadaceae bacterium]
MNASNGNGKLPSETLVETVVMPGRNGGTLRRGGLNPKRNGGRPPDAFKELCRELASNATTRAEDHF